MGGGHGGERERERGGEGFGVAWYGSERVNRMDFGMCAAEERLVCSSHLTVEVG